MNDGFSIDDVREHFRDDMQGLLLALGERLRASDAAAVEDLCHTLAGSAALVGARSLVACSSLLRQCAPASALAYLPQVELVLDRELAGDRASAEALAAELGQTPRTASEPRMEEPGFDFADEESAPAASGERTPAPEEPLFGLIGDEEDPITSTAAAIGQPAPPAEDIEAVVREAFAQEAGELLEAMDHQALALERGAAPGPALRELFRAMHTLKGSANTVGLHGLGTAAHAAEDELEGWQADQLDPRRAAGALLRIQDAFRRHLAGAAVPAPEWVRSELSGVLAAPLAELSASTANEARETQDLLPSEGGEARRSLRVAADQLDRLMRLAGELVITRARLAARVSALNLAQSELATSRARLVATVEGFRARNEFVGLAGDRGRTALALAPRAGNRTEELFTDLELDRYEDIHVLARSLTEITGDMGELQGQIQRAIGDIGEDAERLGRAVGGIQSEITRARMVPLQPLFARLHLAIQDAAARAKLSLHVELHGGGTTLDGSIVEGLHGPLTHLVRNAVAHGIEELDDRRMAGKPPLGRITIAARQLGGQIVLTVADDGRGLDLAALHRKGVAMGLIEPVQPIDSEVVRNLVFASGLSTADGVDAVSGRGLGCDAARDGIVRLGGTLTVASEPGNGTVFTITLPLTLAITRALLVKAGDDLLAVPMNFIERILDLEHERLSQVAGQRRLAHGDGEIRLLDLAAALGQREQLPPAVGAALLVRLGEQRFAVQVDGLLRQEDVVVSGLGDLLTGHPLFAGVTLIAGTGGTGLVPIVDLPGLLGGTGGRLSIRQVAANRGARPGTAAARLHRVLFVDDSLSVRKVAEQHLRTLGVEPVLAVDGEDALSKLREGPIGMIFTDLEMPRMHGYDLLRELRFLPAFRALPVVVVTSRSGDKHRQLAEQLGANGYLPKPFTPDQLRDALERWLPGTASEGQRGAGKQP